MADLFNEKSKNWDKNERRMMLASSIGNSLKAQIALTSDMEVMDFGAGTGLLCAQIAPEVQKIIAVDTSESMLEKLLAKDDLKGKVETVNQDIIEKPLAMKFDLIMSAMTLHHVEDTECLMRIFKENLKPGGRIALADLDAEDGTFHAEGTQGIFHHGFQRDDLKAKMQKAGFFDISFTTAYTVQGENRDFPIFLMTAKGD
ncbi:methyltransferase, putative [hydrothermal vent metagenome]|uniref:Methyltransferase, putative n=1 Tax=hydrothermal vent metagenome TaxID=652676 RepID=A0A3B0RWN4_9ZZZZ